MVEMITSPSKPLISSQIRSSWPRINLVFHISSTTAIPIKSSIFSYFSLKITKPARTSITSFRISAIPPRDRVIDFGKYKGKMLGSLPSTYLKWVSRNLRAGDMEEWAKLADQVLDDPVYRDRVEWETAEKILNGDAASHCSSGNGGNAVSQLLEISERFGWDNEDKSGWSNIDFGLLGTSNGGRIPRVAAGRSNNAQGGNLKKQHWKNEVGDENGRGRRRERRERVTRLREKTSRATERTMGEKQEEDEEGQNSLPADGVVARSPFPGREALLKKVLNRQRL